MSLEAPLFTQDLLQRRACAADLAVCAVVRTHHSFDSCLFYAGFKSRQIGLFHILRIGFRIKGMPQCLRSGVNREMLGAGRRPQVSAVVASIPALNSLDEPDAEPGCQERILAVGLMSSAPSGIAENIHIGRPEGQSLVDVPVIVCRLRIVFRASLPRDAGADFLHQILVKSCRQANGLREHGCGSGPGNAMQRFVPPVILRNIQSRNGRRVIAQLRGLFLQRHSGYQLLCAFSGF